MGFLRWLFGKQDKKTNFIEPHQDVIPAKQNQEVINETGCLTFCVDNLQSEFKEFSRIGESVKLWIPKINNPDKVYIYHRDGPGGCLGIVPSEYSDIVISHLKDVLDYTAIIEEMTDNMCKIKCRLSSKEETEHKKVEKKESLKKELTKAYNPKKPITLMLATKKKDTVKKGEKLLIEFNDLDSYLQGMKAQECHWHIKFLNQSGETIGIFENNKSTIQKILKVHFNNFLFDIEVLDTYTRSESHVGVSDLVANKEYYEEGKRINWNGYPVKLIITPFKSSNTTSN